MVFAPFQNCTLQQSEDRKELNEEGFPGTDSCLPYLTVDQAVLIMGEKARVSFLPSSPDSKTCSIVADEARVYGVGNVRCTISASNIDRAKDSGTETLIGESSKVSPFYFYSYARQDTSGNTIKTYVLTVGAFDGHSEGVSCGLVFDKVPEPAEQARAVEIGKGLVEIMAGRAL